MSHKSHSSPPVNQIKGDPVWGEGREWKPRTGKETGIGEGKERGKRKTCSPDPSAHQS